MVLLNAFSTPLMLSGVNVALPAIARDLGLQAVTMSWIPMAYLMASAMFVLIFGRVADLLGRRKVFLTGTALVILTSLLGALAQNGALLLAARFLQGLSAAMLYATQVAIVSSVFPAGERGRAIGLIVAAVYAGLASGPLLGGLAVEAWGWRASFLLQLPLAVAVLYLGLLKVPGDWRAEGPSCFDTFGAFTYAGGILLLCLGVTWMPDIRAVLLLLLAALVLGLFLRHARDSAAPLWDVRLFFSNRLFTLSCLAALIMYSATYANVVLISLYLQYLKGLPAGSAGLIMMVQPLAMALLSPLAGRLSDRVEPRFLASLGMALTAAGLAGLALLDVASPLEVIVLALLLTGVGFSLFSSPNVNAVMGAVDKQHLGSAGSTVATMRVLGQLLSIVLVTLAMTLILDNREIGPGNFEQLELAITLSFGIAAGICLPGIVISLKRGRAHRGFP